MNLTVILWIILIWCAVCHPQMQLFSEDEYAYYHCVEDIIFENPVCTSILSKEMPHRTAFCPNGDCGIVSYLNAQIDDLINQSNTCNMQLRAFHEMEAKLTTGITELSQDATRIYDKALMWMAKLKTFVPPEMEQEFLRSWSGLHEPIL